MKGILLGVSIGVVALTMVGGTGYHLGKKVERERQQAIMIEAMGNLSNELRKVQDAGNRIVAEKQRELREQEREYEAQIKFLSEQNQEIRDLVATPIPDGLADEYWLR